MHEAQAEYERGLAHYHGGGVVPQNASIAFECFRHAAQQGHSGAQDMLGYLYQTGFGPGKDLEAAKKWFALAAAQGQASARRSLKLLDAPPVKPEPHRVASGRRVTHCWRCKRGLDSAMHRGCTQCGWIKCWHCAECGCDFVF